MKREIRFRAWDGTRMYHFHNHEWTLNFNDISGWNIIKNLPIEDLRGLSWNAGEASDSGIFELMQYTGLKDKNGKEIYEGDIVKWGEDISQIVYQDRGFWVESESFGYEGEDLWNWGEIEIVGNIHANPELIKT